MRTFLFWMVYSRIWDKCIVRFTRWSIKRPRSQRSLCLQIIRAWAEPVLVVNKNSLNGVCVGRNCSSGIRYLRRTNNSCYTVTLEGGILHDFHSQKACYILLLIVADYTWWRHQMETFSALLAICAGNSPVPGEFPAQRPVTQSFDVYFDMCPNKRLSKQSLGWWFDTSLRPLWRHRNDFGPHKLW